MNAAPSPSSVMKLIHTHLRSGLPRLPLQLEEQLEIMKAACSELHDCPAFMKVLQAVLALGNHLNEVRVTWGWAVGFGWLGPGRRWG